MKPSFGELSSDNTKLYLFNYIDLYFVFSTVNLTDGSVIGTTHKCVDTSGSGTIDSMDSYNGRVYIKFTINQHQIAVYNTTTNVFDYIFQVDGSIFSVKSVSVLNNDFMYIIGEHKINSEFFAFKAYYSAANSGSKSTFNNLDFCQNSSISFTDSGSTFSLLPTTTTDLSYTSHSNLYVTSSLAANYVLPTTRSDYEVIPSFWNLRHHEPNLLAGEVTKLDFKWSCQPTGSTVAVSHALVDIEVEIRGSWIILDASVNEIILDPLPSVSSETHYKFGLRTSSSYGILVKRFYLTVSL